MENYWELILGKSFIEIKIQMIYKNEIGLNNMRCPISCVLI